jgi:hypothetical protein
MAQSLICGVSEFLAKNMFLQRDRVTVFSSAVTKYGKELLEKTEFMPARLGPPGWHKGALYYREFTMKSISRLCRDYCVCKHFTEFDVNNYKP